MNWACVLVMLAFFFKLETCLQMDKYTFIYLNLYILNLEMFEFKI